MELIKELNIALNRSELITFVGAGGKTTTMFNLARGLKKNGKSVLVTTTTAIYYPYNENCDRIIVLNKNMGNIFEEIYYDGISVIGNRITEEGKLKGIEPNLIDEIYSKGIFDYILVEGDGAKGKSIKVPADHEPVIPKLSTTVIAVIGLDAVGRSINEDNVHRVEQFCQITKKKIEDIITEEDLALISVSEKGIFKFAPQKSKKLLLLNKAANVEDMEMIERVKNKIQMHNGNKAFKVNRELDVNIDNIIVGMREEGK